MRKLLYRLLKSYTKTEKDRLEVLRILNENLSKEYNEQTYYGNVYNFNIEFIMSNRFIRRLVATGDNNSLKIVKSGLNTSFDEAIDFISKEKK